MAGTPLHRKAAQPCKSLKIVLVIDTKQIIPLDVGSNADLLLLKCLSHIIYQPFFISLFHILNRFSDSPDDLFIGCRLKNIIKCAQMKRSLGICKFRMDETTGTICFRGDR